MRLTQRLFVLIGITLLPMATAILLQDWIERSGGAEARFVALCGGITGSFLLGMLLADGLIGRPMRRLVDALPRGMTLTEAKAAAGRSAAHAERPKGPPLAISEFDVIAQAQATLRETLAEALSQKQRTLREANHRVMNSLQTIAAMFKLQAIRLSDPMMRAQFDEAIARVNAIAMAYRRIDASGTGELIAFDALLEDICASLVDLGSSAPTLTVEADPLHLTPDEALPLTIIVNELVSNALKYGDAGQEALVVRLQRGVESNRLALRNRGALPDGFKADEAKGFGMQMIAAMVRQLRGTLEAVTIAGETEFAVTFRSSLPQVPLARQ